MIRSLVASLATRALLLPACAACFAGGCSSGAPPLGEVHGIVTLDGQPLPSATVVFEPDTPGRIAIGVTNQEGKYKLDYSATASGAIVGPVHVRISTYNAGPPAVPERVAAKYNRATELVAVVKAEGNEMNFALEGDLTGDKRKR